MSEFGLDRRFRRDWLRWAPVVGSPSASQQEECEKELFVVFRGRTVGIKYRWCDVGRVLLALSWRASKVTTAWRRLNWLLQRRWKCDSLIPRLMDSV